MTTKSSDTVFDYRILRLIVGIIAFSMPFIVSLLSSSRLSSISASYYADSRDAFVGMLFIVSALFWGYNGHSSKEAWASKGASIMAILIAIFPTRCDSCETNIKSIIHYSAAFIMFSILTYFCFGPFREKTKGKGGKKGLRSKIYLTCGWIMFGCMVIIGVTEFFAIPIKVLSVTYWGEAIALGAFGIAWFVSGKCFSLFVGKNDRDGKDDALQLFGCASP